MLPSFCKNLGPINAGQILALIDCDKLNIDKKDIFTAFVSLDKLSQNSLSFLYNQEKLKNSISNNSAIICTREKARELKKTNKIFIVKNVQESVAKISNIFYRDFNEKEISKFSDALIGANCEMGDNVIIEKGAVIGKNVKIGHGTIIKHNCIVGNDSKIGSNNVISHSIIGNNIYIGNNNSIGQRGFGFYINQNQNIDIFHSGRVILKDKVSIGSGCTIDRGSFSDTMIDENSYIDNLCHIAHNVEIGKNCALAAMTGIAGSTIIGNNVLTGGQTGIAGHISIGINVQIAAKSGVINSIDDNETVMGYPAIKKYNFIKSYKKLYAKK